MCNVVATFFGNSSLLQIPEEPKHALRQFRKAIRYTQSELAEALGIPLDRYKNYEYGKAEPPAPIIRELRKLGYGKAQTSGSPHLSNPAIPVGFAPLTIRYAGVVPAGNWGDPLASEEFIETEAKFEHPQRFAATVTGDSCYPALHQGDFTIWHSDRTPPYGSIVIAQRVSDSCCTVKQLVYEGNGPKLHAINPSFDDIENTEEWEVIARLVGVQRKVDGVERTWFTPEGVAIKHLV